MRSIWNGLFGSAAHIVMLAALSLLVGCESGERSTDSEGNPLAPAFSRSFGTPGIDEAIAGHPMPDGGYVFTGNIRSVHGDGLDASDVLVARLDASGDLMWHTVFGSRSSLSGLTDVVTAGPASGDELCIASAEPAKVESGSAQDAHIGRIHADGRVLFQTTFDSGGWAGYDYAAVGGEAAEARESSLDALGDGAGGCYGLFLSSANLFDRSNIGFDGRTNPLISPDGITLTRDTFMNAGSIVVARVDSAGNLLWQRRLVAGSFHEIGGQQGIHRLHTTAQGVLVSYFWRGADEQWYAEIAHYARDGRLQFLSRIPIDGPSTTLEGLSYPNAVTQTDDDTGSGRDGQKDDGFVIATARNLIKLSRQGQVQWTANVSNTGSVRFLTSEVTQQCFGSTCELYAFGTVNDTESGSHSGQVRRYSMETGAVIDVLRNDPNSLAYYDARQIGPRSFRVLAAADDGTSSSRDWVIGAPDASGVPSLQITATTDFAPLGALTYDFEARRQRLHDSGTFLVGSSRISILSLAGVRTDVSSGSKWVDAAEIVKAIATTDAGTHIVVGSWVAVGEISEAFAVALDDTGTILWQRAFDQGSAVDDVVPGRSGGAVIALRTRDGSVTLVGISETGATEWSSPHVRALQRPARSAPVPNQNPALELQPRVTSEDWPRQSLIRTASGYVLGQAFVEDTDYEHHGVLTGFDDRGAVLWAGEYGFPPTSIISLSDGSIAMAGGARGAVLFAILNPTGAIIEARRYRFAGGSGVIWPQLSAGRDGSINVAMTTKALASTGTTRGAPFGESNVSTMRLDRNGDVEWVKVHGGLADEFAMSVRPTSDGGLFVSGSSNSLGDQREAWLLRLGEDGLVTEGCNALIRQVPGVQVSREPLNISLPPRIGLPIDTSTLAFNVVDPGFSTYPTELVLARQCSGRSSPNAPGPEGEGLRELSITQSGSVRGLVRSTPNGIFCGQDASSVCSAQFAPDSLVTLTVDDSSATSFRSWGNTCLETRTGPHRCIVEMDADKSVDVVFEPADGTRVSLTTVANGIGRVDSVSDNGIVCASDNTGNDCTESYLFGQRVELFADDSRGFPFLGWADDCAEWGTSPSIVVTMDSDKICTANFSGTPATPQRLNVAVLLNGQPVVPSAMIGTIESQPPGILCSGTGSDCEQDYFPGTVVTLAARPGNNYEFVRWTSSDPNSRCATTTTFTVSVTMDMPRDCVAEFRLAGSLTYLLNVELTSPTGTPIPAGLDVGRVTSFPIGIDCGRVGSTDCQEDYAPNIEVELTAVAQPGYTFTGWGVGSGDPGCAPGRPSMTAVRMAQAITCVAQFQATSATVTNDVMVTFDAPATGARVVDVATGVLDCTATCTLALDIANSPIQLRPVNQGATWLSWIGCDQVIPDPANPSGPSLCELNIAAGPRSVLAEFGL